MSAKPVRAGRRAAGRPDTRHAARLARRALGRAADRVVGRRALSAAPRRGQAPSRRRMDRRAGRSRLGRRCAIVGLPLLPVDRAVACATGRVAAGRRPVATVALAGSARSEDQRRARRLSKRRRRRGAADRPPLDRSARNRAMAR
ncbi:hypothetical protein F01_450088 [Burkholderia cenocepacia]|nr:hypothetical protein F01_450088 [Burkholderia cenocepacia]